MIKLIDHGVYLADGREFTTSDVSPSEARRNTIAHSILSAHNEAGDDENLRLRFDALASHDITYVGILLTARAGGLDELPVPYVLTNCHNSLCAVGGTINEDDHVFGLSAAKRYGAVYVPAHQAVIHSFMREMMAGCGKMILGSDSHTRYGALGTMAIGEGGPELVKQILSRTYDVKRPDVIAVRLTGKPKPGVGPHDVAIALVGAVFKNAFVKNKVLEFVGDGVSSLPIEFRNGIDVMTTETTCLSSVWITDGETKRYFETHGRPEDYRELRPGAIAYYDGAIDVDLSTIEPMIALPFHPSNAVTIRELNQNAADILRETEIEGEKQLSLRAGALKLVDKIDKATGRVRVSQGVIAGCAGGIYDNLCAAADILRGKSIGSGEFALSVYPASQPAFARLLETGIARDLMMTGATLRTAFCGPCFGAGDVPANGGLSIRHTTRNFPNREGSKPGEGQMASVALMDARSIAATAAAGGLLTAADEIDVEYRPVDYAFDSSIYEKRCYFGFGKADHEAKLRFGPNILEWPSIPSMPDDLVIGAASVIDDAVTTTDELIPSGESSSYRSNPYRLSRLALSRRDPEYAHRTDAFRAAVRSLDNTSPTKIDEYASLEDGESAAWVEEIGKAIDAAKAAGCVLTGKIGYGTLVAAVKPGDGSALEQAASCQRVLGGAANIAREYATKRYRSNLINWGMLPLVSDTVTIGANAGEDETIAPGDVVILPGVRAAIALGANELEGYVRHASSGKVARHVFKLGNLTAEERKILLAGCLVNHYREDM
jgi:aconitate hydratase